LKQPELRKTERPTRCLRRPRINLVPYWTSSDCIAGESLDDIDIDVLSTRRA
jgi:hypothetical protein